MPREPNIATVGGANQSGLRDHNERLLLSLIRDIGPIPARDLALRTSLSAQTVSVILRGLESEGLLDRGEPTRGKVGKPSIPIMLSEGRRWSVGVKLGRRSADLALMDLRGRIRAQERLNYRYPLPEPFLRFVADGLANFRGAFPDVDLCGVGIAMPYEIWKWPDPIGATGTALAVWRDIDIAEEVGRIASAPVTLMNDATAACRAEHHLGRARQPRDYIYVFVGALIGGGIVLNRSVVAGNLGNAGAVGPLITVDDNGRPAQLLDMASLHLLEAALARSGHDPEKLRTEPDDWTPFEADVGPWIESSARAIAQAALSACAVIDFEALVIDGAFPASVRRRLTDRVVAAVDGMDLRGLIKPTVLEGTVGANARVIGASYAPISAQYFLDSTPFFAGAAQ